MKIKEEGRGRDSIGVGKKIRGRGKKRVSEESIVSQAWNKQINMNLRHIWYQLLQKERKRKREGESAQFQITGLFICLRKVSVG